MLLVCGGLGLAVYLLSLCRFVCYGVTVVCLCLSTYFTVTNGFIPFRLPLVDALSVTFPGGRREVFLFLGLTDNFSSFYNGFLSLDPNQLSDIALGLNCRFQVDFFPSTLACFGSPTNSTGKSIVDFFFIIISVHY